MQIKSKHIQTIVANKWVILVANTVFFVLMARLIPIRYEENDDVVMCMIANGVISGTPDGHMVFINAIYGWIIAGLYLLTKAVEWYSLSFCILHIMAMSCIVYLVVNDHKIYSILKWLFVVFIYVIWSRIIIGFQFTTTAGLLCFAGCLSLLQPIKKWRIIGVGFIFVASLIRFSAAGLVGLLFAPMLLVKAWESKRYAPLAAVVCLAMIGHWVDGLFYTQPDWAEYRAYNAVRGAINDNPNARLSQENLPQGVDIIDYQLFCSFEGDPQILTLEKLQDIKSQIGDNLSARKAFSNLSQLLLYRIPILLLSVGCFVCVLFNCLSLRINNRDELRQVHKMSIIVLVSSFLLWIFVLLYFGATALLKNRVFMCALLPMCYLMVKSYMMDTTAKVNLSNTLLLCVLFGLIIKYMYQDYKVVKSVKAKNNVFASVQWPLLERQDGLVYCSGGCMIECLPIMQIKDVGFREVGLGWLTCIPFQKGVLESHKDFLDSGILCFGRVEAPPVKIMDRIKVNYGIMTQIDVVDRNERYAIYKFVTE